MLDEKVCERARMARDARFDGRFFIGVVTTGIFCRPICPAPSPKEKNVVYYPSAAAAAAAGLRPCLRCRPESAPGTAPWRGAANSVDRALTLISRGALDQGSVADLAERLGMGDRHLRRLFAEHLGAGPTAVNNTRRLLFAKKLLTETHLPITDIAFASGFGSVRRFNDAFKGSYGVTPGKSRRKAGASTPGITLQLCYRPPYDWEAMCQFLAMRALPGVEQVDDSGYQRTFTIDGHSGLLRVAHLAEKRALSLSLSITHTPILAEVVERVRRMFDVDADKALINDHLARNSLLSPLVQQTPGLRLPGAWDGFELAVRAILGQQVSVAAAKTMAGRVVQTFGDTIPRPEDGQAQQLCRLFPSPQTLAQADLTQIGVTKSRAATISTFAEAVCDGRVNLSPGLEPEEVVRSLVALRGIGAWTAGYIAMRAFNEPDSYPYGDLVLRKAANPDGGPLSAKELDQLGQNMRPWRAYAAMHLWRGSA